MQKSIQFIQCLTIINENAEARRSLRSFPVVAWSGLQTRVISKAIENELADAKETFTVQAIHTSQLRSTCFSFETFTTLISQLNFCFSLFFFQASIHFHSFYFCSFLSHHIYKTDVSFLYFYFQCLLGFSSFFFQELCYLPILPNLFLTHPKWMLLTFYGKRTIIKNFRVSRKKIFDISLYFKLRFNCLSSKGFTNTLLTGKLYLELVVLERKQAPWSFLIASTNSQ